MESKKTLKNKVARLFQVSTFLRSPCSNSGTTSGSTIFSSSAASSRTSPSPDIAVIDPVFLPRNNSFTHSRPSLDGTNPPPFRHGKIDRSNSLPLKLGQLDCGAGCRRNRLGQVSSSSSLDANIAKKTNFEKKERRVRENGGTYETGEFEGRMCPPASPTSLKNTAMMTMTKEKKKKKKTTRKLLSNGYGFSSSSSDDFFSSDNDDEEEESPENIFSSRSFSSDSSEFYQRPSSNRKKKKKKKKKSNKSKDDDKKKKKKPPTHRGVLQSSGGFRPLVSLTAKEEGKSGIPVRKRSNDPYVDFRDSMVEMIVERQIFGAKGLEKLLHSYLSLNSPHHHPVILHAFADISEVLFGN